MSAAGVLTIGVAEGVIEAVRIAGNTHTKDKVIRHYIRTKPGDIYNDRKVAADVAWPPTSDGSRPCTIPRKSARRSRARWCS